MRPRPTRHATLAALLLVGLAACGGDGDGDPMDPDGDPPTAPTGTEVQSVGDGAATISWDPVADAESYTLYYAAESGVTRDNYDELPGGTRVEGVSPPQQVTGLEAGETYYFVVTASNDDGESDESGQVSATLESVLSPSEDTELPAGDYSVSEVDIPENVAVTVEGPVTIAVEENATIAGTVAGDCEEIEIRVAGDLSLEGHISNLCSTAPAGDPPQIRIVVDGEIAIGDGSGETVVASDGLVRITDSATEDEDFEPVFDAQAPEQANAAASARGPARQAGGPLATITGPMEVGELRVTMDQSLRVAADLTTDPGEDAPGQEGSPTCDSSGTTGEDAGDIYLFTQGAALTIGEGVTLTGGNGGAGPDCSATGENPTAIAGNGGDGGGVFLGGENLTFEAGVTIVRGNGGVGGRARAEGNDAEAPCLDGATATATGGNGGTAGGAGYIAEEQPVIQGEPMEAGGNGGEGGEGSAEGGNGADCVCEMEDGNGGDGGDATATGGQGGEGATGSLFPIVPGTHRTGEGGFAESDGGAAGAGADCCEEGLAGGDGGEGGDATAVGGPQGALGMNPSADGQASAFAGDGGDGGDGNPPGSGGAGGEASSTGSETDEAPGSDGEDGEPCPPDADLIDVILNVLSDPAGHEPFTQIAATVTELEIIIDGPTIEIFGNGNWVRVIGTIDEQGNVETLGSGSAAGYPNVSFRFTGVVERDGAGNVLSITGTLEVGGNEALPEGLPVSYEVSTSPS